MSDYPAQQRGWVGEELARLFLETCGYQCLARRYRKPGGEIDLVMRRGSLVIFVEVKTRGRRPFGSPEEALGTAQRARLRRLARRYLHECWPRGSTQFRFDLVAVTLAGEGIGCQLRHYQGIC